MYPLKLFSFLYERIIPADLPFKIAEEKLETKKPMLTFVKVPFRSDQFDQTTMLFSDLFKLQHNSYAQLNFALMNTYFLLFQLTLILC